MFTLPQTTPYPSFMLLTALIPRGKTTLLNMAVSMSHILCTTHSSKNQIICITFIYNVVPTSKMLGRCCINAIQMFCVCWASLWVSQ